MTDSSGKYVRFSVGDEWEALYVDGKLDTISESYLVDERIGKLLGVEYRESAVMEQVKRRDEAPATLDELSEKDAALAGWLEQADKLEAQALALREQARLLREQGGRS